MNATVGDANGPRAVFMIDIVAARPSQLYVSETKYAAVDRALGATPFSHDSYEAVPVKELDGSIVYLDGDTRALWLANRGIGEIKAYFDDDELDWTLYAACLSWCAAERIKTISDLESRVMPHDVYELAWIGRCASFSTGEKS